MSAYKYSAISRDGQRVTGVIEGFNEFDAAERIRKTCDIVLKLTPVIDRDEEGGGIKTFGETTLRNCAIKNKKANKVRLNGTKLSVPFITYDDIIKGGTLSF